MGIKPSAEIPGEDPGAILGNDQVGEVYANIRLVALNLTDISLVADNMTAFLAAAGNVTTIINAADAAAASAAAALVSENAAAGSATAANASVTTASTQATAATAAKTAAETAASNADADRIAAAASATAAAASQTAAATSANTASTGAATATTKAGEASASAAAAAGSATAAAGSATAADGSATAAAGSAASAATAKTAAELAETNAETAETNAELARDAALAAKIAAELARDQAEAIAGGDFVTVSGDTMTGKLVLDPSDAAAAGINFGAGITPDIGNRVNGDAWMTSAGLHAHYNGVTYRFIAESEVTSLTASKANLAGGNAFTGNQIIDGTVAATGHISADSGKLILNGATGETAYIDFWSNGFLCGKLQGYDGDNRLIYAFDTHTFRNANQASDLLTMTTAGAVFSVGASGPIAAYGAGWNGSALFATQDAIYDEIETLKSMVVGAMSYKGTWNATTNSPAIPAAATGNKGWFYKVATAGTTAIDGITEWAIGDWIVSNGASWDKIDNTESVSSVAGLSGAIAIVDLKTAINLNNVDNTSDANKPVSTAQQTALDLKLDKTGGTLSGSLTGTSFIANAANGNFIARGDATNGGQIVLGYGDNLATGITGQANNTWNIDVPSGNSFRIWRTNAAGVNLIALTVAEVDGVADFVATPTVAGVAVSLVSHSHADVVAAGASGFMTGADKTKLNGIATGATANDTDANLKNRANHTGTQAQSTVTNLTTDLAAKAPAFVTIGTQSVSFTGGDSHNNSHQVLSGASKVLTLNNTASVGCSFSCRFTTAWTITCTSLSKNGATPVSGGSVAAGKLVTFVHEGSGTWLASGDVT